MAGILFLLVVVRPDGRSILNTAYNWHSGEECLFCSVCYPYSCGPIGRERLEKVTVTGDGVCVLVGGYDWMWGRSQ